MGRLYPYSLSTDDVDKYNYKWMVMLLLLLSLASFIIPLHPAYQTGDSTSPSTSTTPPPQTKTTKSPRVQVDCWCPAEFTYSYVTYANAYCRNALLAALRGDNQSSVYEVMEDVPLLYKDVLTPITTSRKGYFEMKRQEDERDEKREELKGRVQKLVTFQAPIMLLLAAILLTVPHVIWSFLSACCGSFNVEQTLKSASTNGHSNEEISNAIAIAVRTCPKTMSLLYLVKKIMSVVVVLVLLIVVSQCTLHTVEELDKDLDSVSSNEYNGPSEIPQTIHHYNDWFKHPKDVIVCAFQIRQLQTIQSWSVQCSVRLDDEKKDEPHISTTSSMAQSSKHERNLLKFESLLFKIVTAVLAMLTVGNVASLCAWVCKLLTHSSRNFIGLSRNAPMDIVFLVQMARVNASVEVVRRLAQSSSGKDEGEMMS